jgi:hypothetical protein
MNKLPDGAVKIHLYNIENVLRPRGSMKKESLSVDIKNKLDYLFHSWTDPIYEDSISEIDMIKLLHKNLIDETNIAFGKFIADLMKTNPQLVEDYIDSLN